MDLISIELCGIHVGISLIVAWCAYGIRQWINWKNFHNGLFLDLYTPSQNTNKLRTMPLFTCRKTRKIL